MKKRVHFYFDFVSPYVWLGWNLFHRLWKRHPNVEVHVQPVLFAGLLNALDNVGPGEVDLKLRNVWLDATRVSQKEGISIAPPHLFPFRTLRALRLVNTFEDVGQRFRITEAILKAIWEKSQDPEEVKVLWGALQKEGLSESELQERSESSEAKQKLLESTQEAVEKKVFGVPTWEVDGNLFWGQDRLEYLNDYLSGQYHFDDELFARFLEVPLGVRRDRGRSPR